jgi:hypothetical protein
MAATENEQLKVLKIISMLEKYDELGLDKTEDSQNATDVVERFLAEHCKSSPTLSEIEGTLNNLENFYMVAKIESRITRLEELGYNKQPEALDLIQRFNSLLEGKSNDNYSAIFEDSTPILRVASVFNLISLCDKLGVMDHTKEISEFKEFLENENNDSTNFTKQQYNKLSQGLESKIYSKIQKSLSGDEKSKLLTHKQQYSGDNPEIFDNVVDKMVEQHLDKTNSTSSRPDIISDHPESSNNSYRPGGRGG